MLSHKLIALSESQNHLCCYCGITMLLEETNSHPDAVSIDHIKPISQGGRRHFDNEVAACRYCNGSRDVINAEVYFYLVEGLGRERAAIKAKRIRSVRTRYGTAARLPQPNVARVTNVSRYPTASMAARAEATKIAKQAALAHRNAIRSVERQPVPVTKPNGSKKNCDFDPRWRVPLEMRIPVPPKPRIEPPPISKMSKQHRRQTALHERAVSPAQMA